MSVAVPASNGNTLQQNNPVLKLKADDYKTIDQLKKAQYSSKPRFAQKETNNYKDAAAVPKVDASVFKNRSEQFYSNAPYGDFRDEFIKNGYCVVKGALSKEKARYYEQKMYDWVKSFECTKKLDLNDKSTWVEENLPSHGFNDVYSLYSSSHEKFMWDARQEPGVIDAFSKVWGTDKLLVSFDGFNFSLPNRKDVPVPAPWPHVDQSPFKTGMQCVQGIINLSNATGDEDATLVVYKGTTMLIEEFFKTQTDKADWIQRDFRYFSNAELNWFHERGVEIIRVKAEPGDLILWDSRTIHYGGAQGPSSDQVRSVIYASYSPAEFASPEALERKREIYRHWLGTSHWAHDNIVFRNNIPLTAEYKVDPENREAPLEPPEETDQLLRLAGMKPYD